MDKATLSKLETGKVANPTYLTIRTYAKALGKRVVWRIEEEISVGNSTFREDIGHQWIREEDEVREYDLAVEEYDLTVKEMEWLANRRAEAAVSGTSPAARIIGLTEGEIEALLARRADEVRASAHGAGKSG
jgi:transcriptional regulator with XRE-family HTH domain